MKPDLNSHFKYSIHAACSCDQYNGVLEVDVAGFFDTVLSHCRLVQVIQGTSTTHVLYTPSALHVSCHIHMGSGQNDPPLISTGVRYFWLGWEVRRYVESPQQSADLARDALQPKDFNRKTGFNLS
jgi:hypothetical protein